MLCCSLVILWSRRAMLLLRNFPVLLFSASSWPNYHLLVLAHAALLAIHAVLASLLLLACFVLAMLCCACSKASYAMLCLIMACLCLLGYHACLSRCTCDASVTLVCVPVVPVICFSASYASQWSIGSFLACWLTSLCSLACSNWSIWSIQCQWWLTS